jgi:hypothetical protein
VATWPGNGPTTQRCSRTTLPAPWNVCGCWSTEAQRRRGRGAESGEAHAKGLKSGYNPYDSGALGKTERKKKLNLRELSKWIETKRKVEGKPDDEK